MVMELRNYLLKPGVRDEFIRYFKKHFIDSQKSTGAFIPAMFTIKDEPDRFFWIRGFDSMEQRSKFLFAFYGGEVWKKFGPAANDMMLEWHNVHLVKPLADKVASFANKKGIYVVDFYRSVDHEFESLIQLFNKEWIPLHALENITNITLWISEMGENDFPRLSVYQFEDLLIVITHYKNEKEYQFRLNHLNAFHSELVNAVAGKITDKKSIILYPV
ncbi:hypothetical protein [Terrimonas pollutisoli]|uniref:hypothetical protein n=1 Tax=Terrimonas pollutisoli TaxID=3034147 RepID=UPI0023EB8920|nr:hypothetical protein [Terrimonas sp. H1YJ31]